MVSTAVWIDDDSRFVGSSSSSSGVLFETTALLGRSSLEAVISN